MMKIKLKISLRNLWKNNIWLDSLSCSIHYKNLLRKRNRIIENDRPNLFSLNQSKILQK